MNEGLKRIAAEYIPLMSERKIVRYQDGKAESVKDLIVTEYVLTIYVNEQEMATIVCSPEHLDDLVIGFLTSEGIIRALDQLEAISISSYGGVARVRTCNVVNFNQSFYNKRYIASCCGKSRQTFYFYNDAHTAKRVDDDLTISPDEVLRLIGEMEKEALLFRKTGGVHIAGLCDLKEGLLLSRADIGRHNALDKIYGYVLRSNVPLKGKAITFSGRLSSEVLLKVAKIGAGIVLAKSAPTALALDIADELNITTIGFVRGSAFNVYTHPWRLNKT